MIKLIIALLLGCNFYSTTTVVVSTHVESDTVRCMDFNGNLWEFEGIEDWEIGDYCTMIMNDKGTESIYDDEIISCRYSGWLDGSWGWDGSSCIIHLDD